MNCNQLFVTPPILVWKFLYALTFLGGWPLLLVACGSEAAPTVVVLTAEPTPGVVITMTKVIPPPVYVVGTVAAATPAPTNERVQLDLAMTGQVTTIDPQISNTNNQKDLIENLFVGLTRFNTTTKQVEPMLAQSWEVSPDGRVWYFNLRTDMYWVEPVSDGVVPALNTNPDLKEVRTVRQVVADDVVYAVQRACDPETVAPDVFVLYLIVGCEAVNRQTSATIADLEQIGIKAAGPFRLEVQLTKPASYFLAITTLPLMRAVPRDVIVETDFGQDWAEPQTLKMSSGPFVLSPKSDFKEQIILVRNPFWPFDFKYDELNSPDVVTLNFFKTADDAFRVWQKREMDVSPLPLANVEELMERTREKVVLLSEQTVFYVAYNHDSLVFRNASLRRAFSAAINREELIEEVYGGLGLPMQHFTPPGMWGAPPLNEVGIGYDPDYARQQLNEAGFASCKFLPPIRYLVSTLDASLHQAEEIRDMWVEELGCDAEQIVIEQVQFGTLLANTRPEAGETRPDIWDLGWAAYYPDSHNWLFDVLHCTGSDNRLNRPCDEVDNILARAAVANPDLRPQLYRQVEDIFFGRDGLLPLIPIFVRANYLVRQTWLDYVPAIFGGEQYDTYFIDAEIKKIEQQQ